jgi:hypothetical protein
VELMPYHKGYADMVPLFSSFSGLAFGDASELFYTQNPQLSEN